MLGVLVVILLGVGVGATTAAIISDTRQNEILLAIGLLGLLVALGCAFGIGALVGKQRTVYSFGCKGSTTITVNSTGYHCNP